MHRPARQTRARIWSFDGDLMTIRPDTLATEEPLEIRLLAGQQHQTVAITMRTPGNDFELAAGLLHSEGIVAERDAIDTISYCIDGEQRYNVINVRLRSPAMPDIGALDRRGVISSACGVCGKTSLDALAIRAPAALSAGPRVAPSLLAALPGRMRDDQELFASTGAIHAAALFDSAGQLLAVREDVGRHNALDKLIGWALLAGRLPLSEQIVLLSGRASFELLQKCLAAGAPLVCAVSAPSSLALDVARTYGITLVGFLRGQRLNVYCGIERIERGA